MTSSTCLQDCHCDVWVVVHRPAVLEEAVSGVASTAFDLRANVPNAADGAAKIHEGVDLAVPLPRGLYGNYTLEIVQLIPIIFFKQLLRTGSSRTDTRVVVFLAPLTLGRDNSSCE